MIGPGPPAAAGPGLRLAADAVAPLARARLRPGRRGWVASRFPRTANVRLAPGGPEDWVSLHAPGPLPSPFGIACPGALPAWAVAGTPVAVEPGGDGAAAALRLGSAWRLALAEAPSAETAVPPGAPAVPAATLRAAAAIVTGGLLPVTVALLMRDAPPGAPCGPGTARGTALDAVLASQARPVLLALFRATRRRDPAPALRAAVALLGLGPGLTPAGDDLVIGWLAGLQAGGGGALCGAIAEGLGDAAASRTTPLGTALVTAALAGHVGVPASRFVAGPGPVALTALLAVGATSGADFLAGYALARRALGTALGAGERGDRAATRGVLAGAGP